MLIDLQKLIVYYKLDIRGVLHIGAHSGQEYEKYCQWGIQNMIFFEPVQANFKKLEKHLQSKKGVQLYNLALGNEIGVKTMFIEKRKGESCSLLEPGTHLELHPQVVFTDKEEVSITKLDTINFDRHVYNMINIDVQGYELEVFKGATNTLQTVDIIYSEVNFEEVYKGCCLVGELDRFLAPYGFIRVVTKDSKAARGRQTWGDALYLKK